MEDILGLEKLKDISTKGSAFFIYSSQRIHSNISQLRTLLGAGPKLVVSLKANPNPWLIHHIDSKVDGFDVSSEIELRLLQKLGVSGQRISLSGPGKTSACLKLAQEMKVGMIQADSLDELSELQSLGAMPTSLRLHTPDIFSVKLGFSTDELARALEMAGPPFVGLHVYMGREQFSFERLHATVSLMTDVVQRNKNRFINEPYFAIGPGLPAQWSQLGQLPRELPPHCHFEVGRGLLASSGVYAAQVLSKKNMDSGRQMLIINGGLQHLGSPFVTMAQKISDIRAEVIREGQILKGSKSEFMVVGSLCLGHDILHPRLQLPIDIQRGDWILFPQAGAYGLTAGVPFFIGQELPREFMLEHGELADITLPDFRLYHEYF